MKGADNSVCFFPQRVLDTDYSSQHAADCKIEMGIFRGQAVKCFLSVFRYPASFILKDEVVASDYHPLISHIGGNAVCYNIIHPGMHFLMYQAPLHRFSDNRIGHGVGKMLLQAGCNAKQLIFVLSVEYNYICDLGPCLCKGSCLVKYNGVCCCHCFHIPAALYRDMVGAGLTHG